MRLRALLADAGIDPAAADADVLVRGPASLDARRCEPGGIFVAVRGRRHDGHDHAAVAVAAGAVAVIGSRPREGVACGPAAYVRVGDPRRVAGPLAHAALGHPAAALTVVGVTGTNGKTTTAFLLRAILEAAGVPTAVVGTERAGVPTGSSAGTAPPTTPEATELAKLLRRARDDGARAAVIEASSQGLDQHRLGGLRPDAALLTQLAREHLEYHGTMEAYAAAKARLFGLLRRDGIAAASAEDPWAPRIAGAGGHEVRTSGRSAGAELRLVGDRVTGDGTELHVALPGGTRVTWRLRLVGGLHADNALAAARVALELGIDPGTIGAGLASAPPMPGRMEAVRIPGGPLVLLDAAHSGHGLERALADARRLTRPGGRVVALVGCTPLRDRADRREVVRLAVAGADRVVGTVTSTSDAELPEDPRRIHADMAAGAPDGELDFDADRTAAALLALDGAGCDDVVLLAAHNVWVPRVGRPPQPDPLRAALDAVLA